MLEIFVPRKENTYLWGGKFNIKERKMNKPCVFLQSRSGLRPALSEPGEISQGCRACEHLMGLDPPIL